MDDSGLKRVMVTLAKMCASHRRDGSATEAD